MMWARSVKRSSIALHSRALGILVGHSENGKLVVTIIAACSARPAIYLEEQLRRSVRHNNVAKLVQDDKVVAHPAVAHRVSCSWLCASIISVTISAAVVKRTRLRWRQAATARATAK